MDRAAARRETGRPAAAAAACGRRGRRPPLGCLAGPAPERGPARRLLSPPAPLGCPGCWGGLQASRRLVPRSAARCAPSRRSFTDRSRPWGQARERRGGKGRLAQSAVAGEREQAGGRASLASVMRVVLRWVQPNWVLRGVQVWRWWGLLGLLPDAGGPRAQPVLEELGAAHGCRCLEIQAGGVWQAMRPAQRRSRRWGGGPRAAARGGDSLPGAS